MDYSILLGIENRKFHKITIKSADFQTKESDGEESKNQLGGCHTYYNKNKQMILHISIIDYL